MHLRVSLSSLQPPLQFFLHAMEAKEWDVVKIVTAASNDRSLNPTYATLAMMASTGALGEKVRTYKVTALTARHPHPPSPVTVGNDVRHEGMKIYKHVLPILKD